MGVISRWNSWKKRCSVYQILSNSSLGKSMEIRLLRVTLNISWRGHISNKELYRDLPTVSTSLQIRRLQLSGHCWRSKNETVSQLTL